MPIGSVETEYALALRARNGDPAAVEELVALTQARLFALAYAELRNYADAQDALASGLLLICRNIGDLREPERAVAWMQSIVRNEAHRIRRTGRVTVSLTATDMTFPTEGGIAEPFLLRLDIEQALSQIPVRQAEAVHRFYVSGQPIRDIAIGMGTPPATVRMWLHRGRQQLRVRMEGYGSMTTETSEEASDVAKLVESEISLSAPRAVAVLHSNLEEELQQRVVMALGRINATARFLTLEELGEPGITEAGPWDVLQGHDAFVIAEPLGERSVFEYILLLRASWEIAEFPIAVITETIQPDSLRALAFHTLGVAGLASRDAPESLDYLFQWTGGTGMSREARGVILFADDEARRAGQTQIGTEHLLLGLLREKRVAHLLREELKALPDQVAGTIRQRMEHHPIYQNHLWRTLTEQADVVLQLAREEASSKAIEPEHLLIGLIRAPEGLGHQVLLEAGVTLPEIRNRIPS